MKGSSASNLADHCQCGCAAELRHAEVRDREIPSRVFKCGDQALRSVDAPEGDLIASARQFADHQCSVVLRVFDQEYAKRVGHGH